MKNLITDLLCTAAVLTAATTIFAAKANNLVILPNPPQVVSQEYTSLKYTLEINGKPVDLGTLQIVKINDRIMVPLTATSEALGFTVTWDNEKKSAHMDNGRIQTDLTIGNDNYCAYSSKALGRTAPASLGAAPTIIGGSTYVPVEFYKILFTGSDSVSVKDNVISISTGSNESKKASGSTAKIPCPIIGYSTLDEARKAIGFQFATPSILPDGYKMKDIVLINNELAEVFYFKRDRSILYRTAKGNDDISGNYNTFDKVKTITIGNMEVTIKGLNDSINLATWSKDGISFSLSLDEAVNEVELSTIIESIK